jgi:hypothetical protein
MLHVYGIAPAVRLASAAHGACRRLPAGETVSEAVGLLHGCSTAASLMSCSGNRGARRGLLSNEYPRYVPEASMTLSPLALIVAGAVEIVVILGGWILGLRIGHWLGPIGQDEGLALIRSGRRQGRVCIAAALISYYVPALTFILVHYGWTSVEPYLRAHLFDGFGCAALYALVFRHFRDLSPVTTTDGGTIRLRARARLIFASTIIAVASVYVAGAGLTVAIIYGLVAGMVLLSFWCQVVSAKVEPPDNAPGRPPEHAALQADRIPSLEQS